MKVCKTEGPPEASESILSPVKGGGQGTGEGLCTESGPGGCLPWLVGRGPASSRGMCTRAGKLTRLAASVGSVLVTVLCS